MSTVPTNPRGPVMISYHSEHVENVERLDRALNERGVPTWRDRPDMRNDNTNTQLRRVLDDPNTSGAVLWITKGIETRPVITKLEIPRIVERLRRDDRFKLYGVVADDLSYGEAAKLLKTVSLFDFGALNLIRGPKAGTGTLGDEMTADIAMRVVEQRLERILELEEDRDRPLQIQLNGQKNHGDTGLNFDLVVDLSERFSGREASLSSWKNGIIPVLKSVIPLCCSQKRPVEFSGRFPFAATVVAGIATRSFDTEISWLQRAEGENESAVLWPVNAMDSNVDAGIEISDSESDSTGEDLAIVAELTRAASDVEAAMLKTPGIPAFHSVITTRFAPGQPDMFLDPRQACKAAAELEKRVHKLRKNGATGGVHIFGGMPNALAMALGRRLVIGPRFVHAYEYDQDTHRYNPTIEVSRKMIEQ